MGHFYKYPIHPHHLFSWWWCSISCWLCVVSGKIPLAVLLGYFVWFDFFTWVFFCQVCVCLGPYDHYFREAMTNNSVKSELEQEKRALLWRSSEPPSYTNLPRLTTKIFFTPRGKLYLKKKRRRSGVWNGSSSKICSPAVPALYRTTL